MTTHILTPKDPHPVTGLKIPILGWHFTGATALDVLEGARFIQTGGWWWMILPHPTETARQQMRLYDGIAANQITPTTVPKLVVENTQWFTFDGFSVRVLENAVVETNYDVTTWTPPPPPEESVPDPEETQP